MLAIFGKFSFKMVQILEQQQYQLSQDQEYLYNINHFIKIITIGLESPN